KKGGALLAGLDNGVNYLFDEDESHVVNFLPFDPLSNPEQMESLEKADCGVQFSHSIGEQIGGQIRAGFRILDIYDDTNGAGFLHEHGVPTFWATRAIKE
ncbi:MAG: SAM-dependent methyltransferase, partial [Oscillospiraceae bacterium]|nr:SAM-dependent methyltransferase [Oscillospiraceae bacterium]